MKSIGAELSNFLSDELAEIKRMVTDLQVCQNFPERIFVTCERFISFTDLINDIDTIDKRWNNYVACRGDEHGHGLPYSGVVEYKPYHLGVVNEDDIPF